MRIMLFLYAFLNYCFVGSLLGNDLLPPNTTKEGPGKVILITGASRGIGWETAKKLASQGHRVYASMRSLDTFSGSRENWPSTLQSLELDVTKDSSINRAFDIIIKKENRLDVLINNAGCAVFGPLEVTTIEQAKDTFEVNFFGTMRLMQAALPIMRKQNKGLIINLSSTSGVRPFPGWDIYGASKFAIEGLSEAVAAVACEWNIDVVVVEPGTTSTDFMKKSTEIGKRWTKETQVYENFMSNATQWMSERLANGQNPAEVADIISAIVASPCRQFRYQTSSKGQRVVSSRHCDPTGEKSINEQKLLIKELWKGLLEA